MKETNPDTIEQEIEKALTMYAETVSPSKDMLVNILNQIPEKENIISDDRRAIRSPYMWLARTEMATLFFIMIAVFPTFQEVYLHRDDPFYTVDKQIEYFEAGINDADNGYMLVEYNYNDI